jgi:hypothetical protein
VASAQAHLRKQGVQAGDLFLFFGWFRHAELVNDRLRYTRGSPSFHSIFGWLQIDEMRAVGGSGQAQPAWLLDHPHILFAADLASQGNTIYVASEWLSGALVSRPIPGGGVFTRWTEELRLTAPGCSRSIWRAPAWLKPQGGRPALSFHGRPDRWTDDGAHCILKTVAKGQEFVLDLDYYPEAIPWLRGLISRHA